jgi:hypothetical protein
MKAGSSDMLPMVGECLEHLYENESRFWDEPMGVINEFPHFEQNSKMMVAYSALFGKLWELSDPYLFVVQAADGAFEGLYADAELAETDAEHINGSFSQIVPVDNDQNKVRNPS